jgi:hypothetical protein
VETVYANTAGDVNLIPLVGSRHQHFKAFLNAPLANAEREIASSAGYNNTKSLLTGIITAPGEDAAEASLGCRQRANIPTSSSRLAYGGGSSAGALQKSAVRWFVRSGQTSSRPIQRWFPVGVTTGLDQSRNTHGVAVGVGV